MMMKKKVVVTGVWPSEIYELDCCDGMAWRRESACIPYPSRSFDTRTAMPCTTYHAALGWDGEDSLGE